MIQLNHKGYFSGPIDFDGELFSGTVAGLRDVVHFEGSTGAELKQAFQDSVDDYLAMCEELGREPRRAYSGKVALRMDPELHRRAAGRAEADGVSLNAWIARQLEQATAE